MHVDLWPVADSDLYESPFTDHAPTGPETVFADADADADADVDGSVAILRTVKSNAVPAGLQA